LPNSCHAPVFGTEMYKILQKSDLTFNSHASINKGESANMRLFEATGVGTCLISDYGPNISDMFEPDVEIVTYRSVEECIEKVEYLSSRPEERARIAAAGQKRTLTDHSIASRCETIDGHFQRLL
jgi:spore maturation protein CgeB